jgi:hypothetical protein
MGSRASQVAECNDQPYWWKRDILIEKMGFPPTNFKLLTPIKGNFISL